MERLQRLLRLARLRGDRVAIATLETRIAIALYDEGRRVGRTIVAAMTETELRALWGDR